MKVYLDYAATTPTQKEVVESMLPYFDTNFGNPSSIHSFGQNARGAVDNSRSILAKFLGAKENEIIFTGSGSEADNLAIRGIVKGISNKKVHIITSAIEHHAVIKTCEELEKKGLAEVTYVKPNGEGVIEVEKVRKAIRENTVLVTIMYVNNEIGTIQPIREIGKMVESINTQRAKENIQKIYFHTDAVQATQYLAMNVDYLHVDMLTIAGHKIGAPKGVGILYVRQNTQLRPIITGGGQEFNLRAGTENVPYIVGLAKAVELVLKEKKQIKKIEDLRNYFIREIAKVSDCFINGSKNNQAPHIVNVYFKGIEGEAIVLSLDLEGVACSTGSACTSQALEPSHVIMSVYDNHFRSAGSVRFSFSGKTTKKEIDFAIKKIIKVVKRLRLISPYWKESK